MGSKNKDETDDSAALVQEVLEELPAEDRGEREEWAHHEGWHRREDVNSHDDNAAPREGQLPRLPRADESRLREAIHRKIVREDQAEGAADATSKVFAEEIAAAATREASSPHTPAITTPLPPPGAHGNLRSSVIMPSSNPYPDEARGLIESGSLARWWAARGGAAPPLAGGLTVVVLAAAAWRLLCARGAARRRPRALVAACASACGNLDMTTAAERRLEVRAMGGGGSAKDA